MSERKKNEKIMEIERSIIEIEAEEVGMPVADYFVKKLNSLQDPDYYQTVMDDVVAKVVSAGHEYRITATFPSYELADERIRPLLRFRDLYGPDMWIAIAPKKRLQAIFIWTRPPKNARYGEEEKQGR